MKKKLGDLSIGDELVYHEAIELGELRTAGQGQTITSYSIIMEIDPIAVGRQNGKIVTEKELSIVLTPNSDSHILGSVWYVKVGGRRITVEADESIFDALSAFRLQQEAYFSN